MKVLYLGLDIQNFERKENAYYFPIIKIIPKPYGLINKEIDDLSTFTHIIFTSPRSVDVFCAYLSFFNIFFQIQNKALIAIGKATKSAILKYNLQAVCAKYPTQEGIIDLLKKMDLGKCNFLIPRSSIARNALDVFFKENKTKCRFVNIYDTVLNRPLKKINFEEFDEIFFTSPSTVRAFINIFKKFPPNTKLSAIGPITQKAISEISVKKS